MVMKVGSKLRSAVDETEVIVIKSPETSCILTCGGAPMVESAPIELVSMDPAHAGGTKIGKRYTNSDHTLELLVIKPGGSSLALDGVMLELKATKPLPASD